MTDELVSTLASPKRSETVTRTFRLDSDVERGLLDLAAREGLSVNVLANKALREHIEWEALAEKFGFMSFSSTMMVRMMNSLTDEEARGMGRWTADNLAMEAVQYWFKRRDFTSALAMLQRLGTYGNRFKFDHSFTGARHSIILKHDMGIKWSYYYEEAIANWFRKILRDDLEELSAESTENQVSIFLVLKN